MGLNEDFKRMGEEIIDSYDLRAKTIAEVVDNVQKIRDEVHSTLKEFAGNRAKMSAEQKKALTDFIEELCRNVATLVKEFHTAHSNMSKELKKDLAHYVSGIKNEVAEKLREFEVNRNKMGAEQKKALTDSVADLQKENHRMMKEYHTAHSNMSKELKKDLAHYVSGIKNEVAEKLKEFQDERKKMAAQWQSLVEKTDKRRGIKIIYEEGEKKGAKKEMKKAAEETVSPEIALDEKVLELINAHPDGIKVGDMGEKLGVPRMTLGKIAKKLFEEGKVDKKDNLYLPL